MHEVLVNRLGGLSLPRKSVVRFSDRPDMTVDVYRGRKTTMQQHPLRQQYWCQVCVSVSILYSCQVSYLLGKVLFAYSRDLLLSSQSCLALKCLSIGTAKAINFPFVSDEKFMYLAVPVFKHIVMRL